MIKQLFHVNTIAYLYLIGFAGMVGSLPFSNVAMSVSSLWILGTWIIDITTRIAAPQLRQESIQRAPFKVFLWIATLFSIHVLFLWNTEDFSYAFRDLRIKLPLILFPVVVFTMTPVKFQFWKWIKWTYLVALSLAVIACIGNNVNLLTSAQVDGRDFSIFISHIRFGLMLNLGIAVVVQMILDKELKWFLGVLLSCLFVGFMLLTQSMTALVLMFVLATYILLYSIKKRLNPKARKGLITAAVLAGICTIAFVTNVIDTRYKSDTSEPESTDLSCEKNIHFYENGHRVYCNYDDISLEQAWNKRSDIKYRETNSSGGGIRSTLMRYLSSKGYLKTGAEVDALKNEEIKLIESGRTSAANYNFLHQRLDQLLFEYDALRSGSNPSGKSFAQRFEFWRNAMNIIKKNAVFGVGTGDVKHAFDQEYELSNSTLSEEYRLRAHNQILTFWVAFGLLGLVLLPITLYLCFKNREYSNTLVSAAFLIIVFLSFLTEDTLETQAGVSFFAVWISLFFLLPKEAPAND